MTRHEKLQAIRDDINSHPLHYYTPLTKSKSGLYCCPECGSGTHKNRSGALSVKFAKDKWWVRCYACAAFNGEKEGCDTLHALEVIWRMNEAQVMERLGYNLDGDNIPAPKPSAPPAQPKEKPKTATFAVDIQKFADALKGSAGEEYLRRRGFTEETMLRFKLGYDAQRQAVTIPYNESGTYYGRRSVLPNAERVHDNLPSSIATLSLFNPKALYEADTCFVVESPLCAISIEQCGGHAVALSGFPSGIKRLIEYLGKKPTNATLIICTDNDDAGQKPTDLETLETRLQEIGANYTGGTFTIMGNQTDPTATDYRKDPNEVLQKDGMEVLKARVETAVEQVRHIRDAERMERELDIGADMVDDAISLFTSEKFKPMPTGFQELDNAIGGGFIRQQLILLGAAPGTGKTAFTQWIFEGMAERGTRCIYVNLEMSRAQMIARSLSRLAKETGFSITPTAIMQGYRWTETQREVVERAAESYKRAIAPRMTYNPPMVTANLDSILKYIEQAARDAEADGQDAPVVVIDYLQIVTGDPREDAGNLIKRATAAFKSYAMRHNTVVYAIVAHNRTSNSSGKVTMESGRDTSALEYSADLQLGMTFTKCLKTEGNPNPVEPDDLKPEDKRGITVKVTKGRWAQAGKTFNLHFDGSSMTFTPARPIFTQKL